ncbi:MAG: ribonuclease P protein component [Candidatus Cloacimonetes bacterium]|nr:ribonuclease P protein component [Candidatus Cloacimonadota bacterium]
MRFIKKRSEYLHFQNADKVIRSRFFILAVLLDTQQTDFALGITVSKKVGNAIVRNKTKRRIKAWLRQTKSPLPSQMAVNIIALNKAGNAKWNDLHEDLEILFKRLCKQA